MSWKIAVGLAIGLPLTAFASKPKAGSQGVGGIFIAEPSVGVSLKHWLAEDRALAFGIGAHASFLSLHADFHLHPTALDIVKDPQMGSLSLYGGWGIRLLGSAEDQLAIRLIGGISWFLQNAPMEIFVQVVPLIQLTPRFGSTTVFNVGVRYYFPSGLIKTKKK